MSVGTSTARYGLVLLRSPSWDCCGGGCRVAEVSTFFAFADSSACSRSWEHWQLEDTFHGHVRFCPANSPSRTNLRVIYFGIVIGIAALLVLCGIAYQTVGLRSDERRFPAPGR